MDKKLEYLIILDIFLGTIHMDEIKLCKYILSLLLQMYVLFRILTAVKRDIYAPKALERYYIIVLCIFLVGMIFAVLGVDLELIVNRVFPLLSMFGYYLFIDEKAHVDIDYVIRKFIKLYILFAFVIDVDSFCYLFIGKSIWLPISWMGFRFSGPFGDPNFMAIFSGVVFIVVWNIKDGLVKHRKIALSILIVNLLLATALSTLILIPVSFLLTKPFGKCSNIQKQMLVLSVYLWFMSVYAIYEEDIMNFGVNMLQYVYGDKSLAEIKYHSLAIRFDTQLGALKVFFANILGQGPRTIVPLLEHDTHNSYVSIAFEDGIFGFLLILLTLRNRRVKKVQNIVGTFLMLSALLLNVHETTIYSMFIIMQKYNLKSESVF